MYGAITNDSIRYSVAVGYLHNGGRNFELNLDVDQEKTVVIQQFYLRPSTVVGVPVEEIANKCLNQEFDLEFRVESVMTDLTTGPLESKHMLHPNTNLILVSGKHDRLDPDEIWKLAIYLEEHSGRHAD